MILGHGAGIARNVRSLHVLEDQKRILSRNTAQVSDSCAALQLDPLNPKSSYRRAQAQMGKPGDKHKINSFSHK